ncbi:hypothetical protein LP123_05845 [Moraxella bovis]|uniref:Uncharacterized protein n=1 Tax=Moraxella bovis TaxID=476 RepID=A0AAQ2Q7B3_MORBO|nr:hypothetical protein [Moraxella bovis]AWY20068.1 hypothetical protein DQF64_05850 [Moraxella bovis]OOR91417.1 hypothetical protein B0182_02920 [Moraxella bovis]UYZ74790.1 hypothetical protein LP093_08400 [Moraxella bovis]UYZ79283.1 hypothetical protein LP115_05475 [Moraxella bovis]UYZ80139.1 hypothetical protein LP113_08770 [Moraxella bovis]
MSTASFDKQFIVRDEKAIEQFLYDLENAKPSKPISLEPTQDEIEQKNKVLALLQKRMSKLC